MDRETSYYQQVSSSQFELKNQYNPNQKHSKSRYEYWTDSNAYMERPKTQNNKHNIKREGKYVHIGCFMLMYNRNQHNIVKQLSSN